MSKNALLMGGIRSQYDIVVIQYPCMPTTVTLHGIDDKGSAGPIISTHTSSFDLPEGAESYIIKVKANYLEGWVCKGVYIDGALYTDSSYVAVEKSITVKKGEVHTIITDNGSKAVNRKIVFSAPGAQSIEPSERVFLADGRSNISEIIGEPNIGESQEPPKYTLPAIKYSEDVLYSRFVWKDLDSNSILLEEVALRDYNLEAVTRKSDDYIVGEYSIGLTEEYTPLPGHSSNETMLYTTNLKYSDNKLKGKLYTALTGTNVDGNYILEEATDRAFIRCVISLFTTEETKVACPYLSSLVFFVLNTGTNAGAEYTGLGCSLNLWFKHDKHIEVSYTENVKLDAPLTPLVCDRTGYDWCPDGCAKFYYYDKICVDKDDLDGSIVLGLVVLGLPLQQGFVPPGTEKALISYAFKHPSDKKTSGKDSPFFLTEEEVTRIYNEGKNPRDVLCERVAKAFTDKSITQHLPFKSLDNIMTIKIT